MITISKETLNAIAITWDYIAADAYEMCEDDNEIAVEMTIDAGRLKMNNYADAQNEVRSLINAHGYAPVLAAISKKLQLL